MAIIDTITYNGEKELFEIRYNILKDYVDQFVVAEFDKTFSGKPKEPLFLKDFGAMDKVAYHWHTEELYNKYMDMALASPNTQGADHWKREFCQKESIKDALNAMQLKDNDVVFVGDCDEIWNPVCAKGNPNTPIKLQLIVYAYYLNNRSNEKFWGTLFSYYKDIKNQCLNHLRSQKRGTGGYGGWHFTSMHHQIRSKLEDSYTEETYASPQVMEHLEENVKNSKDFLGRNFTYRVDETEWPPWLKEHRQNYKHLLK